MVGQTQQDLANLERFCSHVPTGFATYAYSAKLVLSIGVPHEIADYMVDVSWKTEILMESYLALWKEISDSDSVMVYIEWEGEEIAGGFTSVLTGDLISVREREAW